MHLTDCLCSAEGTDEETGEETDEVVYVPMIRKHKRPPQKKQRSRPGVFS